MLFFLTNSFLSDSFDHVEMLAVLIASFGHDVGHPGKNNRFLINNRDEVALTYNDNAVLENLHASLTFKTMYKVNSEAEDEE